jgi:hypothetical protein
VFNVCPNCEEEHADKIIDPEGAYAVCPDCNYRHKFVRLPLFVLTGASGAGKTTTCLALAARANDLVALESDILWREEFNQPETNYRDYREMWLRVCKNISQAGKPVILCGAALPSQFEQCVDHAPRHPAPPPAADAHVDRSATGRTDTRVLSWC